MAYNSTGDLTYLNATAIVTGISGSLSVVSSLIIIVVYWQKRNSHTVYLLKCLSAANFILSVGIVMGTVRYKDNRLWKAGVYCKIQSFMITYSSIASFWLTFCITLHSFFVKNYHSTVMQRRRIKYGCQAIAWITPAIVATFALAFDGLGEYKSINSHTWCWINGSLPPYQRIIWILMAGKFWELVAYFGIGFIVFSHLYLYCRNNHAHNNEENRCLLQPSRDNGRPIEDDFAYRHNMVVWAGYYMYATRIWGTIRYLVEIVRLASNNTLSDFHEVDIVLFFFHNLGDSGQAIVNFVMFCLCDTEGRQMLIRKLCCCCSERPQNVLQDTSEFEGANEDVTTDIG